MRKKSEKGVIMKTFKEVPAKMRQYWRSLMDSTKKKMTFGAQCLNKIICRAHGDQWRRGQNKGHHKS